MSLPAYFSMGVAPVFNIKQFKMDHTWKRGVIILINLNSFAIFSIYTISGIYPSDDGHLLVETCSDHYNF
jgi:hypothetical protein